MFSNSSFPFFSCYQLGFLLKNLQCFTTAYRNKVKYLCLVAKALPNPGPSNCLHTFCIHCCLTSVPCWGTTVSTQCPHAFIPSCSPKSLLFASPLPSAHPLLGALHRAQHSKISTQAPSSRGQGSLWAQGPRTCLVWCSAVTVLKLFIIFEEGVPHFHFALGSIKYVPQPVGENFSCGQLQHMAL